MASPILGRFILKFFYSQFFVSIPPPTADFSGQTVIVTGSNTGLGFEAVKHLLQLKASKVIIAVRTLSKGETAAEKLRALTGATKNTIEIWQLDLSDSQSVKAFAERANGLDRLDAVISNAGVIGEKWTKVNEMETTLMVNVVNSTLLSLLLLPKLRSSATKHRTRGRFALVGSDMFYVAKLAEANAFGSLFDALNDVESSEIGDRYPSSKLLVLYAIREIAARSPVTPDSDVILDVVTPGLCHSSLITREEKPWLAQNITRFMMGIFARSTSTGGATLVDAVKPDLPIEAHGAFFMDCKIAENGPSIDSEKGRALQKRFVGELFEKLETISPGVTKALR